jgi:methylase of polypeptide subunit release factors|tara:strand:- start:51 stop:269 length:219 start_codon:yes stop_codon:yes gene_type:complete
MKLDNQAIGALMMALQKSLMEQSDIVPVLKEMNFVFAPNDPSQSTLIVANPPVVSLDGNTLEDNVASFDTEE